MACSACASFTNFPTRWTVFEHDTSAISGNPRHATHPINAILNYGYSMLAGQVERTAVTRGLDVAVGSLHADAEGRPSLVYDLMEPLRPVLDGQVLGWAASVGWRRTDFVVTTAGKVRLSAGLARVVAQKAWLRAVDGVVRWYAESARTRRQRYNPAYRARPQDDPEIMAARLARAAYMRDYRARPRSDEEVKAERKSGRRRT